MKAISGFSGAWLVVVAASLLAAAMPRGARAADEISAHDSDRKTIALEILVIEGETPTDSVAAHQLDRLIGRAAANFKGAVLGESESDKARRFFSSVDRALIESDVIVPPSGDIDFLREGLRPHALSLAEFSRAQSRFANFRRLPEMRANQTAGGSFYFFDCDLASIVYAAVAECLGFPVYLVEIPNHTFVRWQSGAVVLNWDPNDGISYSDDYYTRTWHVPVSTGVWPRYFENLSRDQVLSTWLVLCGRDKKARGDFSGASTDFRKAVEKNPNDFGAVNELAWLLATCPAKELRSGKEALSLAQANVGRSRRSVWLQTLGAAQAEVGDFKAAIRSEDEARRSASTPLGWVSPHETLIDCNFCLAAYRHGRTFADATAAEDRARLKDNHPAR